MKFLKKGFLIFLLPLLAFTAAHKFYLSVTNVSYSEKEDALQITSRVFIDDLENVLEERYGIKSNLATEDESKLVDEYLEKYLRAKFMISINNKNKPFTYIGREYDDDAVVFYLEILEINFPEIKLIQVQNEILTDLYDEQQNIVHFKINGKKKSFVLMKENNKGMLNL